MHIMNISYGVFKQIVGTKKLWYQVLPNNAGYTGIFSLGDHLCVTNVTEEDRGNFEATYKPYAAEASSIDDVHALAIIDRHDIDGSPKITPEPPIGDKKNFMSCNWCDKCSWFEGSVEVTDETLVDSGDGLTFTSAHEYWVDMTHGRVTFEDMVLADNPGKWLVEITSDAVAQEESSPGTEDGDYQIDYETGEVTFNSSQANKTVVASYWYAVSGIYTVKPSPGKKIKILRVEVQFSKDIVLNDTMEFMPYGYAGVFAPAYVPGYFTADQLIPLMTVPYRYKTRSDFVNESCGTYPVIPAFGGPGWRGGSQDIITLPWLYLTKTELKSSYGMEIRLKMVDSTPMGGETATATFYTVETDE